MSIIRQLNIDLITDTPNIIIEWFNDIWNKLYVIEANTYHNKGNEFIYYIDNPDVKQWIFYQDNANDKFWCNYSNYWVSLEHLIDVNYFGIQDITKLLVDNALNYNISSPQWTGIAISDRVKSTLICNDGIVRPGVANEAIRYCVVNALKNSDIATPIIASIRHNVLLDNFINNSRI